MKTPGVVAELVGALEAEINNGGFDQFFFNSAGDKTAETIEALAAIGAHHTANIVRRAASRFPGGMPSPDRDKRQEDLERISPDSDAFEDEDQAFYEYKDNLSELVASHETGV
jgi:Domain of unknown function (DUF4375)